MKQPNVLVISDRGEFAQSLMSRWHAERVVPAFTVMSSEVYNAHAARFSDLVIAGMIDASRYTGLLTALADAPQPVIALVADESHAVIAANRSPRTMVLRQHEGWLDLLMVLAAECLRRIDMTERAQRAEEAAADSAGHATLGRYMLEMRHGLNNALTSVLGNAELLLLDPEQFSEEVRDQLTTIRSMSLRMNEIIARFSSLEAELNLARREKSGEVVPFVRGKAVGWSSF